MSTSQKLHHARHAQLAIKVRYAFYFDNGVNENCSEEIRPEVVTGKSGSSDMSVADFDRTVYITDLYHQAANVTDEAVSATSTLPLASPDSGLTDYSLPELPPGWLDQWDKSCVLPFPPSLVVAAPPFRLLHLPALC